MNRWMTGLLFCVLLMIGLPGNSWAEEYDAQLVQAWLEGFCREISAMEAVGDSTQTVDPSRPGEYLIEYTFGTVTAIRPETPIAEEIVEIDVRTDQVVDCRQVRVGMTLEAVLQGEHIGPSSTQLYVLGTQDAGLGFRWAYLGDAGVYGVEYITYRENNDGTMTEYTLTYMIDASGCVEAIRMRCAQTTEALAQQACDTADEIAIRQRGEVICVANDQTMLATQELTISGVAALGMPVAELVKHLGEPLEVQTLVGANGRLLLYEGSAIELDLDDRTGEEVVRGVSASSAGIEGPRGLQVGMSAQEAASLFACAQDVYAVGGVLYGRDAAHPPYAELVRGESDQEWTLYYYAIMDDCVATLEIGVWDQSVTTWRMY